MKTQISSYGHFFRLYLPKHKFRLIILLILLLIGTSLQIYNPHLLQQFIDSAQTGGSLEILTQTALLFIGVAIVEQFIRLAQVYVGEDIAWRTTNQLRADLFQHTIELDLSFHEENTSGKMVERIDGDVNELASFFSQMIIGFLGNSLLLLGIIIFFITQIWQVGIIYLIFSLIALYLLVRIRNFAVKFWGEAREASADLHGFVLERLAGLEDIRSRGAESYVISKLYQTMRILFHKERSATVRGTLVFSTILILFMLAVLMIFSIGTYLFSIGLISLGTVYLYYRYVEMLRDPLQQISRQFEYLQRAGASLKRVEELLDRKTKIKDGSGIEFISNQPVTLSFKDVSFSYSVEKPVLKNISFTLYAGQRLGLLGRTGSGKTTISRLIFRFFDPDSGSILLDGHDIRQARLSQLRSQIALVTQDVQFFEGTLRDNLSFFDKNISDETITGLINELGLRTWFENLSNGLDTVINTNKIGLSSGEAQLLSFIRAFLGNPVLVILDEASSRLDPSTEKYIQQATQRLLSNRTAIIIAHRLETIEHVDEIMIISEGQILEHGKLFELRDNPSSEFARMLEINNEGILQ